MTDQELLEAAAKAAGIFLDALGCEWYDPNGHVRPDWNPLEDDGDALRLAVKLGFVVDTSEMPARVCRPYEATLAHEPNGADPAAATRRAIVRAAAEISKTR